MKVILLINIPKVGKKYEVKDFKEGYAQNVLLSKGLAELATPANLRRINDMLDKEKRMQDTQKAQFEETLNTLKNHALVLHARANEKGHLFKTITVREIVAMIKDISGLTYDESCIEIPHIKSVGDHTIRIVKGKSVGEYSVKILATK